MTDIPTWKQKLEQQYINLAFDPAALSDLSKKEASYLKKKKDEITIRSSAAEYLTYLPLLVTNRTALRCAMKMRIHG